MSESTISRSSSSRNLISMNDSSFTSHKSKKIASLYELDYYEDDKIQPTELPLVNPYLAYQKTSFPPPLKSIKSLIHTPSKTIKEYVQSSRFDKCPITGSAQEQWVTLQIPSDFPKRWIEAGYSHIHFGAIRLALNYHGVEGKPVVARIALLDTRYLKYEDACIAIVEATMNSGLVMVTLFPNFTMALADPNLIEALKVQIHIVGAPQVEDSIIATLHYQFAYRIQDHAFKLSGCGTGHSLFLSVHTKNEPHCIHIPRQIPRKDLINLLPDSRVTNYEKIHEQRQPIQSTESKIISKGNGMSEIRFDHTHLKDKSTSSIFPTQMMMLPQGDPTEGHDPKDPDCYCELCKPGPKELDFYEEIEGSHHQSYNPHKKKTKFKKNYIHSQLYERWLQGDPSVGPLGEDNGKFIFLVDYGPKTSKPDPTPPSSPPHNPPKQPPLPPPMVETIKPQNLIQPCYKKIQKWVKKNPQPETVSQPKQITHVPKIPTPLQGEKTSVAEATLNWQTENAMAQNTTLQKIDLKVTQMGNKLYQVETKVDSNTKIANKLIVLVHKRIQQVEKQTTRQGMISFII
ncbi:hypothetical protein V6N12_063144 [Hibiscus sabdariffa]|uniref:Uncharacterized protein n=1 Tax=Hibiscus sabdariffa TaxID=183260 RepID=A0ABR2FB47_9ROSI